MVKIYVYTYTGHSVIYLTPGSNMERTPLLPGTVSFPYLKQRNVGSLLEADLHSTAVIRLPQH